MTKSPIFALAASKLDRAHQELRQLDAYVAEYERSEVRNVWSRTSTIAFAVHNIYNGMEDVMADLARAIDDHVPEGAVWHQALLDQMRIGIGDRPALLDDALHRDLSELKAFRHLVRHHYGVDLIPEKVEAKRALIATALSSFSSALTTLEGELSAELPRRKS